MKLVQAMSTEEALKREKKALRQAAIEKLSENAGSILQKIDQELTDKGIQSGNEVSNYIIQRLNDFPELSPLEKNLLFDELVDNSYKYVAEKNEVVRESSLSSDLEKELSGKEFRNEQEVFDVFNDLIDEKYPYTSVIEYDIIFNDLERDMHKYIAQKKAQSASYIAENKNPDDEDSKSLDDVALPKGDEKKESKIAQEETFDSPVPEGAGLWYFNNGREDALVSQEHGEFSIQLPTGFKSFKTWDGVVKWLQEHGYANPGSIDGLSASKTAAGWVDESGPNGEYFTYFDEATGYLLEAETYPAYGLGWSWQVMDMAPGASHKPLDEGDASSKEDAMQKAEQALQRLGNKRGRVEAYVAAKKAHMASLKSGEEKVEPKHHEDQFDGISDDLIEETWKTADVFEHVPGNDDIGDMWHFNAANGEEGFIQQMTWAARPGANFRVAVGDMWHMNNGDMFETLEEAKAEAMKYISGEKTARTASWRTADDGSWGYETKGYKCSVIKVSDNSFTWSVQAGDKTPITGSHMTLEGAKTTALKRARALTNKKQKSVVSSKRDRYDKWAKRKLAWHGAKRMYIASDEEPDNGVWVDLPSSPEVMEAAVRAAHIGSQNEWYPNVSVKKVEGFTAPDTANYDFEELRLAFEYYDSLEDKQAFEAIASEYGLGAAVVAFEDGLVSTYVADTTDELASAVMASYDIDTDDIDLGKLGNELVASLGYVLDSGFAYRIASSDKGKRNAFAEKLAGVIGSCICGD